MSKEHQYFLGVDGGATKTIAVVIDDDGRVLSQGRAGPSNYRDAGGMRNAVRNVLTASRTALRKAGLRPAQLSGGGFGIAGLDNTYEHRLFARTLRRTGRSLLRGTVVVANDILAGFRSGTQAPYGACVIAGTGSNAFARGARGGTAFAGGMGPVLTDNGSAKDIGRAVLRAAAASADGRAPATLLRGMVLRQLGVQTLRDAAHRINDRAFTSDRVATFSPLADLAARRGDAAARRILRDAATELALMATTVIRKAHLQHQRFDLVLVGTVLGVRTVLLPTFKRLVRAAAPHVRFVRPTAPFAVGAALLARDAQR